MDWLILQTGVAGPLVFGLSLHTWSRRAPGQVHGPLAALLMMISVWMVGMIAAAYEGVPDLWVGALLIPPTCFMSPLFLLVMLRHSRSEFAEHRAAQWGLMVPFFIFMLAFFTHNEHGLMTELNDPSLGSSTANGRGPLFWAFQIWTNSVSALGLGICIRIAGMSPNAAERRRMWLLGLGTALPLLAHLAFIFQIPPMAFPLTPTALGITSLMLVAAIGKYNLLDVQPLARRDVVEASIDGVVIADADEIVVDLNPAGAILLGVDRREACGQPLRSLFARLGTSSEEPFSEMLETLRRGAACSPFAVETGDGRTFEITGGVPSNDRGDCAGYFAVFRDRTHEQRGARLLHQSQKLESVGTLAAGIAHELNNPLSFVRANFTHLRTWAEFVEDQISTLPRDVGEELRELPDVIDESVAGLDRIHHIVQGLLSFSKMPSGVRMKCDVNAVLDQAVQFAALDLNGEAQLAATPTTPLPAVQASSEQLMQVVLNLLLNAKFAVRNSVNPTIVASTGHVGGHVEIRVCDNGSGVPASIRDKIFDPFFTTREPGEGTGLGLAIAFDVIQEHGGTLECEPGEAEGTCFVIRLPALEDTPTVDA